MPVRKIVRLKGVDSKYNILTTYLKISRSNGQLAFVASVSLQFRSKERETRVSRGKWREKTNGEGVGKKGKVSHDQNRKSRSSVFLCSKTKRNRLLRRLGGNISTGYFIVPLSLLLLLL